MIHCRPTLRKLGPSGGHRGHRKVTSWYGRSRAGCGRRGVVHQRPHLRYEVGTAGRSSCHGIRGQGGEPCGLPHLHLHGLFDHTGSVVDEGDTPVHLILQRVHLLRRIGRPLHRGDLAQVDCIDLHCHQSSDDHNDNLLHFFSLSFSASTLLASKQHTLPVKRFRFPLSS